MSLLILTCFSLLLAQTKPEVPPPMSNNAKSEETLVSNLFVWDVIDERDPFKPYRSPRTLKQDAAVPVDPLTLLDLNQVQILAILWNNKTPRAVLQSHDGKLYTIFRKTRLGTNSGVVVDIREGEVIVVESFDDGFGNIVKEVKPLRLSKPTANLSQTPDGENPDGEKE